MVIANMIFMGFQIGINARLGRLLGKMSEWRKIRGVRREKKKGEAMLPIIRVPEILAKGMESFRKVFRRMEGFEHICRFITGLILSPNKTLQGIYDLQVWEGEAPSRRAMHEAVFESGWDSEALIEHHRTEVAQAYQRRGRQVISLDWTLAHHERGPKIYAVTKTYRSLKLRAASENWPWQGLFRRI